MRPLGGMRMADGRGKRAPLQRMHSPEAGPLAPELVQCYLVLCLLLIATGLFASLAGTEEEHGAEDYG